MSIVVRRVNIESQLAGELIAELNAETTTRYPEGPFFFELNADEVAAGNGAFVVAFEGEAALGCGAVRKHDMEHGELKRMFVRVPARGRGVGGAIIRQLELEARNLGLSALLLETGVRQPEAIGLYHKHGFVDIPKYGKYVDSWFSVCMRKSIATATQ